MHIEKFYIEMIKCRFCSFFPNAAWLPARTKQSLVASKRVVITTRKEHEHEANGRPALTEGRYCCKKKATRVRDYATRVVSPTRPQLLQNSLPGHMRPTAVHQG